MENALSPEDLMVDIPATDAQLTVAYGALLHLGWEPKYAGPVRLIANTPQKLFSRGEELLIEVTEGTLSIKSRSKYPDTVWNTTRKDKKNITALQDTIEQTALLITPEKKERWQKAIEELRIYTNTVAEEEKKLEEELDRVMHISTGSRWITVGLLGITILLFVIMAFDGVGLFESDIEGLIRWGANYKPYTLSGEWWRMFTSIFIHIGIVHLIFNMYALLLIGNFLEPMLGKKTFIITYLCTGMIASLTSLWWHDNDLVSAGASGAIFGLYGVFLALLTTSLIPAKARKEMLTSIGVFIGFNLLYGLKDGVDNAAHLGGLLSGYIIGYLLYIGIKKPSVKPAILTSLIAVAFIGAYSFLAVNKNDTLAFQRELDTFYALEDKALQPTEHSEDDALLNNLKNIALPAWYEAKSSLLKTEDLQLTELQKQRQQLLLQYTNLRIQYTQLYIEALGGNQVANTGLEKIINDINTTVEALKNL